MYLGFFLAPTGAQGGILRASTYRVGQVGAYKYFVLFTVKSRQVCAAQTDRYCDSLSSYQSQKRANHIPKLTIQLRDDNSSFCF